jgi:phosphosulfolactate synthase (CoM biosynthesis protein A)
LEDVVDKIESLKEFAEKIIDAGLMTKEEVTSQRKEPAQVTESASEETHLHLKPL